MFLSRAILSRLILFDGWTWNPQVSWLSNWYTKETNSSKFWKYCTIILPIFGTACLSWFQSNPNSPFHSILSVWFWAREFDICSRIPGSGTTVCKSWHFTTLFIFLYDHKTENNLILSNILLIKSVRTELTVLLNCLAQLRAKCMMFSKKATSDGALSSLYTQVEICGRT